MNTEIGFLAGRVWHYLNENGEVTTAQLKKALFKKKDSMPDLKLAMGLGWLLRENKIKIEEKGQGRGYRMLVSLINYEKQEKEQEA